MFLPTTHRGVAHDPRRDTRNFLLLTWAVAVFSLAMTVGINSLSPDDAMRLVEVRDLLAGQSWFDMTQYRLDPPAGMVTHWSRLIDLPLALIIKSASMFVSSAVAEKIALIVWPTTLLLVFLAGVSQLARELAGEIAARVAPIFAVLMAPVLQNFLTGSIHHHNAQLTLTVWSLALTVRTPARARESAAAGLLGALSVAVGQEMVPAVATLAAAVGLRWVAGGEKFGAATMAYALALAAGAVAFAAAIIAPESYLTVHCDAISVAQVGTLVVGGVGLAALAALPGPRSITHRIVAAAALALSIAAYVKIAAPQCAGNPYAQLDPRLIDLWLSSVSEASSLFSAMHDLPQRIPAYFGIPLAALILGTIRCVREDGERRWNWIACTAVQAVLILVAIWELRGVVGANAVGAALLPAALLRMAPSPQGSNSYFGVPRPALLAMAFLNPVVLLALGSGAAHAVAATAETKPQVAARSACRHAAAYAPLADLRPGLVLAFIDAGPFILMTSGHSVLAAPYHRNQAGNLAMLDMFLASPDDAKVRMAARGVDYVAFCPGAPGRYIYAARAPASLVATLGRDEVPSFLEKISPDGAKLTIYRVRR